MKHTIVRSCGHTEHRKIREAAKDQYIARLQATICGDCEWSRQPENFPATPEQIQKLRDLDYADDDGESVTTSQADTWITARSPATLEQIQKLRSLGVRFRKRIDMADASQKIEDQEFLLEEANCGNDAEAFQKAREIVSRNQERVEFFHLQAVERSV